MTLPGQTTVVVHGTQGTPATVTSSGALSVTLSTGGGAGSTSVDVANTPTVISASSGLVQVSGTVTVLSASSGLVQISGTPAVTSTFTLATPASTSGAVGPVTSSFGVLSNFSSGGYLTRTLSSGIVTLSSLHNFISTSVISTSVVLSSAGLTQISGTVTVLSASSGLVQVSGVPTIGITSTLPGVGKFVVATSISKVTSSATTLWSIHAFTTALTAAILRCYNATTSSVTMNTGVVAAFLVGSQSTATATAMGQRISFGPRGFNFATACSFDVVVTATSTAAVAGTAYVTALVN